MNKYCYHCKTNRNVQTTEGCDVVDLLIRIPYCANAYQEADKILFEIGLINNEIDKLKLILNAKNTKRKELRMKLNIG